MWERRSQRRERSGDGVGTDHRAVSWMRHPQVATVWAVWSGTMWRRSGRIGPVIAECAGHGALTARPGAHETLYKLALEQQERNHQRRGREQSRSGND
jgi:hypothetical protein